MLVVVIADIGKYLTKNKTTVAICDSESRDGSLIR